VTPLCRNAGRVCRESAPGNLAGESGWPPEKVFQDLPAACQKDQRTVGTQCRSISQSSRGHQPRRPQAVQIRPTTVCDFQDSTLHTRRCGQNPISPPSSATNTADPQIDLAARSHSSAAGCASLNRTPSHRRRGFFFLYQRSRGIPLRGALPAQTLATPAKT
jgi:hypothetical protein